MNVQRPGPNPHFANSLSESLPQICVPATQGLERTSFGCYVASHAHCAHVRVREKERASKRARERERERESQLVRVRACVRTQRLTDVLVCTGFLTGFLVRVFILHLAPIHTHEFVRAHMHKCTHMHTRAHTSTHTCCWPDSEAYLKPDDKPVSFIRMLGHIWGIIGHMCCT